MSSLTINLKAVNEDSSCEFIAFSELFRRRLKKFPIGSSQTLCQIGKGEGVVEISHSCSIGQKQFVPVDNTCVDNSWTLY